MHTPRALVVALVILGTPAFSQGGPGGAVDPRMVGTWDLKVQNLDVWVLKIESAGSYVFTIEGPVAQPGHSGVFQTGSGRWSLRSTAGTPWTDGGAYTFADQDTVSMAGNLGVAVWKRRKGTDQKSVDASGGAVVSAGRSLTKVLPLVGAAHAQARAWQQDAALIAIYVKTGADGKVSLSNLAGPANFNGDFVSMQFHSVQAGLVHAYGVDPTGRVAPQSMPMPPGTETARIPELFLDLDAAFVKARELGLKVPPAGGKSFMDARLVGVRGEAGRANAATWTITAVDMSGAFPVPMGEPTVLNAASGEQTTEEALSGRLERRMLAEELSRGKTFPNGQYDYSFFRKESDAWAVRWRPDLKLWGAEISGSLSRGRFVLDRVISHYFAPSTESPGGSTTLTVGVFPYERATLLRVDEFDKQMSAAELRPQVVPDRIVPPETAIAKLREIDPALKIDPVDIQLVFGGNLVDAFARSGKAAAPGDAGAIDAIKSRWLWLSRAERTVQERENIFVWNRVVLESVAIDAVTGDAVLKGNAATGKPDQKPDSTPRPITQDDLDTVPKLIDLLKSSDSSHRQLAAYRLGVMAVDKRDEALAAVPALIETLKDRFPVTRQNAAIALGNIGPGAKASVLSLVDVLRDQDHRPRDSAAKALGQIASEPAVAVPALGTALLDTDGGVRSAAAVALGQFGEAAAPAAEALGAALSDQWPGVFMPAAEALGKIGKKAGAAAPALAGSLRSRNANLRTSAAKALAAIGPDARAAVPDLTAALRDKDADAAAAAATALGSIGPDARPAIPALIEALKNSAIASSAAEALSHFPDAAVTAVPAIVEMLERTAGNNWQSYDRGEIIKTLGRLGAAARPAVPMLVKILRDGQEHADNRKAAAGVLQQIGPAAQDGVASLAEHVKDKTATPESRSDAAKVLGAIGAGASAAVPALTEVINDSLERDDVRYDANKARETIQVRAK